MNSVLNVAYLDQIFSSSRTPNGWADRPVEDDTVREIYDLMKRGPTSANSSPARFVWVRSADGKATLAELAAEPNKPKILKAPVTVIIGHDLDFAGELPKLLPHNAEVMQKYFAAPGVAEVTAMRNGTLQGAYLIVAARRWDWTAAPCRASTMLAWIRSFFPARESSRTLSAALATAIQLPCFRAILALVLSRPVAGPDHGVDRTRSYPGNGEVLMSAQENVQIVKDFFAAIGSGDKQRLLALVAEDIEWIIPGEDWPLAGTRHGHAWLADLLETASKSIETSTEPREFVAQGDRVLVVGFARGKIKATNKTFEDDWIFAITVRDGRLNSIREYVDTQAPARASQMDASGPA